MDKTFVFFLLDCAFFLSSAAFSAAWLSARARAERAERLLDRVLGPAGAPRASGDGRLAGTVEALEHEVERLAEGQQFVARLLAERHDVAPPPRVAGGAAHAGRVITPH
jgi:hypothetical protein